MDKIRILCYGDSNTWGTIGKWVENDDPSLRYENRWTQILQQQLGDKYTVIEEGLGAAPASRPIPPAPGSWAKTI